MSDPASNDHLHAMSHISGQSPQQETFIVSPAEAQYRHQEQLREFYRLLMYRTPRIWVTPVIIAANVAVFALMVIGGVDFWSPTGESLIAWGANFAPLTTHGEWWRLFTSMFVHGGLLHIGLNMWVLKLNGGFVERFLGNVNYLISYLLSGLAGSLASVYWNPLSPSVGASGAIFGIFGALLGFVLLQGDPIAMEELRRVRKSVLTFLGLNLMIGYAIPHVDMAAHIGGLIGGFLCGLALSRPLNRVAPVGAVRAIVVTIIGAGLLVGIARVLPVNVDSEREQVRSVLKPLIDTEDQAHKRMMRGKLSPVELAEVIEQQILPPWKAECQRVQDLKNVPADEKPRFDKLLDFTRLLREAWELEAEALRTDDGRAAKECRQKKDAAFEIFQALRPPVAG